MWENPLSILPLLSVQYTYCNFPNDCELNRKCQITWKEKKFECWCKICLIKHQMTFNRDQKPSDADKNRKSATVGHYIIKISNGSQNAGIFFIAPQRNLWPPHWNYHAFSHANSRATKTPLYLKYGGSINRVFFSIFGP